MLLYILTYLQKIIFQNDTIDAQSKEIESLKKKIKEYKILEEKCAEVIKTFSPKGPCVFVGNIIVKYHQSCTEGEDPYFWPKKWFPGLQDQIVYDYKKTVYV